jgi:hypothetical protein
MKLTPPHSSCFVNMRSQFRTIILFITNILITSILLLVDHHLTTYLQQFSFPHEQINHNFTECENINDDHNLMNESSVESPETQSSDILILLFTGIIFKKKSKQYSTQNQMVEFSLLYIGGVICLFRLFRTSDKIPNAQHAEYLA